MAIAQSSTGANGFAQKVDPIWNEPVSTGTAGALARSTLNLKPLDAATVSRCALIAGEGARAPSINLSLSAIPLYWAVPSELHSIVDSRNLLHNHIRIKHDASPVDCTARRKSQRDPGRFWN